MDDAILRGWKRVMWCVGDIDEGEKPERDGG